jgi:hypothetical protein
MVDTNGYAEQYKDWSEEVEFTTDFHRDVAKAAAYDRHANAHPYPAGHSWFLDYAVHALWQTPLSLCDGTRAWPQVLSLSEQSWTTTHTHLCSAHHGGAGAGAVGPTTEGSRARRGVVRHWLRVTHTTRRQVTRSHVGGQLSGGGVSHRREGRQSPRGQHVGTRGERSALVHAVPGGGAPCARR